MYSGGSTVCRGGQAESWTGYNTPPKAEVRNGYGYGQSWLLIGRTPPPRPITPGLFTDLWCDHTSISMPAVASLRGNSCRSFEMHCFYMLESLSSLQELCHIRLVLVWNISDMGRVLHTEKTRQTFIEPVSRDMIREEKSLIPCNPTQREVVVFFYRGVFMAAAPAPICWSRCESCGYFSDTSSCVRVASAYDRAFTISPSVRDSSAARSKYFKASVTLPC